MKNKALKYAALLISFCLVLTACTGNKNEEIQSDGRGAAVGNTNSGINDYRLRDKPELYTMYEPGEVVNMLLTVSRGNEGENTDHSWSEINSYSVYDYESMGVDRYKVEGLLQIADKAGNPIEGEVGYRQLSPNCTVQIRGQSSSRQPQKNYKIRLKENKGSWRGQTTIALNKHVADGMRFKNKLCYDLISGIDEMMGLRTTFVHLWVKDNTNGEGELTDYGLYTQVEQLNKTALKAHGMDKNGQLYKINMCEFYRYEDTIRLKDDPEYDQKKFEDILEIKGSDDHTKLIAMLDELNDFSVPIDRILAKHFDVENLSYWMAFHILMGNYDTQSRNFYIYSPLNSEKWYFISWDNDGSLSRTQEALNGSIMQAMWENGISNYWGNVLFQRALKDEGYKRALDEAVEDIYKYLTGGRTESLIKKYSGIAKPYLFSMPDVMYSPLSEAQYERVISSAMGEIKENYDLYKLSYKKPMPFFIATPKKQGSKLSFEWNSSYDFNSENISYSFELSRDCYFNSIIQRSEDIQIPAVQTDMLKPGQYFIRVRAKNESGYTQDAFDYYHTENGKISGTKCFYVKADGSVVEDVYVED